MEIAVVVLSFSVLVSLCFTAFLYSRNLALQKVISNMKNEVEKTKQEQEELVSIDVGDKAIIPNYGLTHTSKNASKRSNKEDFQVTYEVEIVEVSTKKVKVRAVNFTSTDKFARDPKNKHSIIQFLQDKWVDRKSIELLVDEQMRRDRKLKQILG